MLALRHTHFALTLVVTLAHLNLWYCNLQVVHVPFTLLINYVCTTLYEIFKVYKSVACIYLLAITFQLTFFAKHLKF